MLKPDKTKIKLSFLEVFLSLQTNIGIGEANISQERLIVLANPWFFVMTRHVVPVHSVVVELIENRKTIFRSTSLNGLTIVRLWLANAAAFGPIILVTFVGRCELLQLGGPEPAIDMKGLQIGPITALEIAKATRGPDVLHLVLNDAALDKLILGGGFQRN